MQKIFPTFVGAVTKGVKGVGEDWSRQESKSLLLTLKRFTPIKFKGLNMLVLSRKVDDTIIIGDNIKIQLLKIKGNTIRIGIEAPTDVKILRGELAPFGVEAAGSEPKSPKEVRQNPTASLQVSENRIEFDVNADDLNALPNPFVVAHAG